MMRPMTPGQRHFLLQQLRARPGFLRARAHFAERPPAEAWQYIRAARHERCKGACCAHALLLGATPAPTSSAQIATQADQVLVDMQRFVDYAFAPAEMIGAKMMDASRALTKLQVDALQSGADGLGGALETLSESIGKAADNIIEPTLEEGKDLLFWPLLLLGGLVGLTILSGGGQAALAAAPAALARTARPL